MELLIIFGLLFAGVGLLAYQVSARKFIGEVHLPAEIKGQTGARAFDLKEMLSIPASIVERVVKKSDIPLENLKRKLTSAGRPMPAIDFLSLKSLLTVSMPVSTFIL